MKVTGLQSTTKVYEAADKNDYSQHSIYNMDDPYWRQWLAKNTRREDNWRNPSIHAYNHKPYGIIGEVVNIDKLRK